jgi:molybdate transport system substrate-binding protein
MRALASVLALLVVAACGGAGPASSPSERSTPVPDSTVQPELVIYGAASLTGVLEAARAAYEQTIGGVTIVLSTDSSAALATKIQQGAPADLFLSADTANAQKLIDEGLVEGDAISFASNQLVVIVPAANPREIESPFDLAEGDVRVIAAADEVPIAGYANQVVANLASRRDAPDGFADGYAANIVSREENVKAIVSKIELGEGDAAIVYVTDAADSTKVGTVSIPGSANVTATYAAVVVKGSAQPAEAQAFLDWLQGAEGLAILQGFGFLPPPE